jgi:hypothetical protein
MSKFSTAAIAGPLLGDKLYQERARAVLPLLVRQAEAAKPIFYSALAHELGMPNPRNLNYVLGCIGNAMERLSKRWKATVPPIQCLVVNKRTGLPGEGVGWFLVKKKDYAKLPLRRKREIIQAELQHVFAYPHWQLVLKELSLSPTDVDFTELAQKASRPLGGGEGPQHRRLKDYIATNPRVVGLPKATDPGDTEYCLPSGDVLDVSFQTKKLWLGVEVKPALSSDSDILRGIFQCVKYLAILDAVLLSESRPQNARALLVLEGQLPTSLVPLCNLLSVEVIDGVCPIGG